VTPTWPRPKIATLKDSRLSIKSNIAEFEDVIRY